MDDVERVPKGGWARRECGCNQFSVVIVLLVVTTILIMIMIATPMMILISTKRDIKLIRK